MKQKKKKQRAVPNQEAVETKKGGPETVLPQRFLENMQELLKDEYPSYLESFREERLYGLRVNTSKISVEDFLKICPFELEPIPWIGNGFYYKGSEDKPAKHPFYFAGLYYLQEPSAMTPANRLPVRPGDKVLDICAAPGGKTTELGAKLNRTGLLVTNDISNSRAKALLKNVELFGFDNATVLSEPPYRLSERFSGFFDKILIDAPCSGEGMFRKDNAVIRAWEEKPDANEFYGKLQKEILDEVVKMLKPGGMLMYSTCTFSQRENEQTIADFLAEYPDFEVVPIAPYEGFAEGLSDGFNKSSLPGDVDFEKYCVRIWPMKMKGEGHFLTLLRQKDGENDHADNQFPKKPVPDETQHYSAGEFVGNLNEDFVNFMVGSVVPGYYDPSCFRIRNNYVSYVSKEADTDLSGLRVMRNGLFMGECLKNRFEPGQAFAMSIDPGFYRYKVSFPADDPRAVHYLKGETISFEDEGQFTDGTWVLVCVEGFALGFAKYSERQPGVLKNKYLPGWRWQ